MLKSKNPLKPRDSVLRMDPYRPPSSGRGGKMRLDFNENTVGCSPRVLRKLKKFAAGELAVYPEYEDVLPQFAAHFCVAPDEMTLTNGTDEAIQLVVNTYVNAGDPVVVLRPTYAMYRFYAQVAGASIHEVDYHPDLSFPQRALLKKLNSRTRAILLANPNNPTGTLASWSQLKAVLEAAPRAAVLVDEAYFEFSGWTALLRIGDYPNLFVSRTFSKAFGLAALRLGCLFSRAGNIQAIRRGQSPYSVNAVAVALGLEAIWDTAFVEKYAAEVLKARQMLCQELDAQGLHYYPSSANFVLVDFGDASREMRHLLDEQEILVRDRSYELPGCVRITVGTVAQTRKLLAVLRRAWQKIQENRRANAASRPPRLTPARASRKIASRAGRK